MSRMLASFVLAGGVLAIVSPVRADDAEDKAAALAEKLGGKVTRDDKSPGKPVVIVDLSKSKVTGADLRAMAALPNLTAARTCKTRT